MHRAGWGDLPVGRNCRQWTSYGNSKIKKNKNRDKEINQVWDRTSNSLTKKLWNGVCSCDWLHRRKRIGSILEKYPGNPLEDPKIEKILRSAAEKCKVWIEKAKWYGGVLVCLLWLIMMNFLSTSILKYQIFNIFDLESYQRKTGVEI